MNASSHIFHIVRSSSEKVFYSNSGYILSLKPAHYTKNTPWSCGNTIVKTCEKPAVITQCKLQKIGTIRSLCTLRCVHPKQRLESQYWEHHLVSSWLLTPVIVFVYYFFFLFNYFFFWLCSFFFLKEKHKKIKTIIYIYVIVRFSTTAKKIKSNIDTCFKIHGI